MYSQKSNCISCSTQTQTNSAKNNNKIKKIRLPSYKDINLKIDSPSINNQILNQLRGKKILKKNNLVELYNNLYTFDNNSKEKNNISIKIQNNRNKQGEISLSFGKSNSHFENEINHLHTKKKDNFRILKKISSNNKNNKNNKSYDDKNLLLTKKLFKLPQYNVKKILKSNVKDDFVSENDTFNDKSLSSNQKYLNEEDKSNIFSYINYKESIVKERFPKIANSNNRFELSNDIKKEFEDITNVFRRYNSNKKRIDDALLKIKNFNKNNLLHKNPYNQRFDDSKKIFNKIDLNILKINKNRKNISPTLMEKNLIRQKIRKVIDNFSHNNTDDNMIKMKFKYKNID